MISQHLKNMEKSPTLAINEKSRQAAASGHTIYRFGFGQSPFPVPLIIQEELRNNSQQKEYLPVGGLPELTYRISIHHQDLNPNMKTDPDQIIIGPGSKELLFLIQLATDLPLLLPNPSWVSYAPQAKILQKEVFWIPTNKDWLLDPIQLEEFLKENQIDGGLLVLNYPNNPSGAAANMDQYSDLVPILRKHNILVISDEIYGLTTFTGQYNSIAEIYAEGTIITSGLSKWAGAGGWRLGYALFPSSLKELAETIKGLASETFSAVAAPIQYAAVKAYSDHPDLEHYRKYVRLILKEVAGYSHKRLVKMGLKCRPAVGGFYLFPDFCNFQEQLLKLNIRTSKELCNFLLTDAWVALLPGSAFGRPEEEMTVRLSYVDFDGEEAFYRIAQVEGVVTEQVFQALFPKIIQGLNALEKWLENINQKV
jgi:aspartate aminotransferase